MKTNVDLTQLAIDRGKDGQPDVRTRRHIVTRYVLPLTLILGFLSLVAWASRDLVFPPRDVTVVPVYATTAEAQTAGTPLFNAAGWIEPRPTPLRVAALAPGVVEKLLVVEDQPVKAGEAVAELVKDDARLVFGRASADLKLREAELNRATAQFTAAETRYDQPVHLKAVHQAAEAALAKVETALKSLPFETRRGESDQEAAQKDYDGKLASTGVVPGVEIDIARSKLDSAKALVEELRDRDESLRKEQVALARQRDALRTQLELLTEERGARDAAEANVQAAMARVAQARVVQDEARLQLDRMTVVAPVDGRVMLLIAHPGARIGSGMTQMAGHDGSTVVTMYRPEMLQVRVDVRFEDIPKVSPGQLVEIDNPALSEPVVGEVLFKGSDADIQKNTLQVKVAIPDPPRVFKPEMLVDVTFLASEPPDQSPDDVSTRMRLYAPLDLIQNDDSGAFLWVADQSSGVARKYRVPKESGPVLNNEFVEIKSGLTVSSRLIVSGIEGIQDGDRIRITGEDQSYGIKANSGVTGLKQPATGGDD